jgi:hypothetical protein
MPAVERQFVMRSGRRVMRAKAIVMVIGLAALAGSACVPDWAKRGETPTVLLMTTVNSGNPLTSDVRFSNGVVCPDFILLRVENHGRNPNGPSTGFRGDMTIERYEVRYFRSDGRNVEGVDVPYRITGNLAQEIQEESAATVNLEVVRRQAKLEPPLSNLRGPQGAAGGVDLLNGNGAPLANVITTFAEITLWARSTILRTTNSVSARVQIDFGDFNDTNTSCTVP